MNKIDDPRKTYLEILEVHDKEVPIANLLAFFFRPMEKHNLGDTFIRALLNTKCFNIIPDKSTGPLKNNGSFLMDQLIINNTKVSTEVGTEETKRIDILINTDDFVICIEFKINHDLDNPLESYKDYIEYNYPLKRHYFIVLTPYKKEAIGETQKYLENHKEFKQVILSHFIQQLKEEVPTFFNPSNIKNPDYYEYFRDFVQTIENRKIRSIKHSVLIKLSESLSKKNIISEFRNNNDGGYLKIRKDSYDLKIRIMNSKFHIEKWSKENIKESLLEDLHYDAELDDLLRVIE